MNHTLASPAKPDRHTRLGLLLAGFHAFLLLLGAVLLHALFASIEAFIAGAPQQALLPLLTAALCAYLLWRALRLPGHALQGYRMLRHDAPQLFRHLSKLQRRLDAPRLDEVLVDDNLEVRIHTEHRFGIPLWTRHRLVIGLPLLQVLSRRELTALLAQEYARLSRRRGWRHSALHDALDAWQQLAGSLTSVPGHPLQDAWLRAFWRLLAAPAQAWAEDETLSADALAAELVGARTLADALIARDVRLRFLRSRFWQGLWARADHQAAPPFLPHASMRAALSAGLHPAEASTWLNEAMQSASRPGKPSLARRLQVLACPPELPLDAAHSAAQSLLPGLLPELQKLFDVSWLAYHDAPWRLRFHSAESARETVRRLQGRVIDALGPEELCHYGLALDTLGRRDEALPVLERAALHPNGPIDAALALARLLQGTDPSRAEHFLALSRKRHGDASAQVLDRRSTQRAGMAVLNRLSLAERA